MTPQNPSPSPPPPEVAAAEHQLRPLDDAIEQQIGDINWKQISQFVLVSVAWFFDAQQNFITIFTDAYPKWSCANSSPSPDNHHFPNACNARINVCRLPQNSWSWDSPTHASTVSQWALQCASPIVRGLPASSFYLGCLVGGLALATLADSSLGRKNMLVLSCFVMSLFGCLTAVSQNIWMYVGLRFLSGLGRAPIGTCAFVLGSEVIGRKWRGKVGIFGFVCYYIGFLSLPILGYFLRRSSWRLLYLFTCCPCLCYSILVYFSAHESPRWLFIKGRNREFVKTLTSLARTENISMECLEWIKESKSQEQYHFYSAIKILFHKKWALKRLLIGSVAGFGVGLAYYGMPLGLMSLPFNLYLSVGLNALAGLLSSFSLLFVIGRMRRKALMIGLCLLSGICNVAGVVVARPKGLKMGLELLAFFEACMAFDVLLVYALELFPTCVRNLGVSVVREAILVGGFVGPMIVAVAGGNGLVSYGLFGVAIMVGGVFVVCLPETKGRVLCDSMEEEEEGSKGGLVRGVDCG